MKADAAWRQYLCKACGYVYDEQAGDPDGGLPPGTRYEDIPEDWYCPICGVTKSDFVLCMPVPNESKIQISVHPEGNAIHSPSGQRVSTSYDVLIVGGGMAGWALVEALRSLSLHLRIAVVSDCDASRYDKPLLSVSLSRKMSPKDLVKETGLQAADRLNVTLHANTAAISIDHHRRQLRTTRGEVGYRYLVLAHGVQPLLPPGLSPQHCWRINHLEHYKRFRAALDTFQRTQRVLIVGAGLIGVELADDLARSGHHVTLVDSGNHPLSQLAHHADQVQPLLAAWSSLPICFVGKSTVSVVTRLSTGLVVTLSGGGGIEADHVVVSTGQRADDRLARSAGLAWRDGIAVDPVTLQSSQADIYAMGDCISLDGKPYRFVEPHRRQAATIASQITGMELVQYEHQPLPVRVKTRSCQLTL